VYIERPSFGAGFSRRNLSLSLPPGVTQLATAANSFRKNTITSGSMALSSLKLSNGNTFPMRCAQSFSQHSRSDSLSDSGDNEALSARPFATSKASSWRVPTVKLLDFGVAQLCEVHEEESPIRSRKLSHSGSASEREGSMRRFDDSVLKSSGTPAFYAPEMCISGAYHGRPADIWACGITLYMLVCGQLPFEADNMPDTFLKIREEEPDIPTTLSEPLRQLIAMMLNKTPSKRPSFEKLRQDPWVTMDGVEMLPAQSANVQVTDEDIMNALQTRDVAFAVVKASDSPPTPLRRRLSALLSVSLRDSHVQGHSPSLLLPLPSLRAGEAQVQSVAESFADHRRSRDVNTQQRLLEGQLGGLR